MEYLVSGGAGFIGSGVVRALAARGAGVRVLDNLSTGRRENLARVLDRVELVEGDVRDRALVEGLMPGIRHVIHAAALASVPASIAEPLETESVNVQGTLNLLEAARREGGVRSFVLSSSSAVYGNAERLPVDEDAPPKPLSPYAVQKLACEHYCSVYRELYGLKTLCLRYFNVYGPRQNARSAYAAVIPRFIAALARGEPPVINGDGRQTRDFTFIDDVVAANLAACEAPQEAGGAVLNVARGEGTSVNELASALVTLMNSRLDPEHGPALPGEVRHSRADAGRAAAVLRWRAATPLKEGLRETAAYFARP